MIISHKHKFIFIKTRKTAGTSIEMALGNICGDEDIITPIGKRDEGLRERYGLRGKQNTKVPLRFYTGEDIRTSLQSKKRLTFRNHDSAEFIRNHIPENIWNSYYKFCFERNPYDRMISWYYFWLRDKNIDMTIDQFVKKWLVPDKDDRNLYNINGLKAVDKIYKYEDLNDALIDIAKKIDYEGEITLEYSAKRQFRKDYREHQEVLSQESIELIQRYYRSVFEDLNYKM